MKTLLKRLIPESIKLELRNVRDSFHIKRSARRQADALRKMHNKKTIKIAFLLIIEASWKFDKLYKEFASMHDFDPIVMICPLLSHGNERMISEMEKIELLCKRHGYQYIKSWRKEENTWINIQRDVKPDIVIITNPHSITRNEYTIHSLGDVVSVYIPYSIRVTATLVDLEYNQAVQNTVWRNYYESDIHYEIAKKSAQNKGNNVVVSGYPAIDMLVDEVSEDDDQCWKHDLDKKRKRVIWAPHWTVVGATDILQMSCFIQYCELMLDLARTRKDKIQLIMRPHPFLIEVLRKPKLWGPAKTDAYLSEWNDLENCSINQNDYFSIFKSSDALIHDSGSFMAEYLALDKPVLYTIPQNGVDGFLNKFGGFALKCHYLALSSGDVADFIDNIVCGGNDPMKEIRANFKDTYLYPCGVSPSVFIAKDIVKATRAQHFFKNL